MKIKARFEPQGRTSKQREDAKLASPDVTPAAKNLALAHHIDRHTQCMAGGHRGHCIFRIVKTAQETVAIEIGANFALMENQNAVGKPIRRRVACGKSDRLARRRGKFATKGNHRDIVGHEVLKNAQLRLSIRLHRRVAITELFVDGGLNQI